MAMLKKPHDLDDRNIDDFWREFSSAKEDFRKKVETLEATDPNYTDTRIGEFVSRIRRLFVSKEHYGKSYPHCTIKELAKWLHAEDSFAYVEAACSLMRTLGLLPDVRNHEDNSIRPDVIFTHIPPLYDESLFKAVHGALNDFFAEYLWYNNVSADCTRMLLDGEKGDVLKYIEGQVNMTVQMARLQRFDTKGATLH